MIFEWDNEKAANNYHKHGIKFEDAIEIFEDPNILTIQDRIENGDYRWQSIGYSGGHTILLLVAHTYKDENGDEIIRIISARRVTKAERKNMSIVRYRLENMPSMSKERKEELQELAKKPDSEIDFSDIPPLTEDFWKNAVRGLMYRPIKKQITARIDADVLEWLKSSGKGYQTRLNSILRQEMERSRG